MLTDGYFFIPDQLTVKLMSKFNENVFNFILTEVSSDNFISKYWDIEFDPSLSPSHGEDIPYLFDYVSDERNISKREQFSSERRQERRLGGADGPGREGFETDNDPTVDELCQGFNHLLITFEIFTGMKANIHIAIVHHYHHLHHNWP